MDQKLVSFQFDKNQRKAIFISEDGLLFTSEVSELRKKVFAYKNKNIKICPIIKINQNSE